MSEAEQIADRFIAEISDGWGEDVEREDKERLAELISAALAAKDVEIATLRAELAEARRERDRLREAIEGFISSYPWGPCMPELAGLNAALEGKP